MRKETLCSFIMVSTRLGMMCSKKCYTEIKKTVKRMTPNIACEQALHRGLTRNFRAREDWGGVYPASILLRLVSLTLENLA